MLAAIAASWGLGVTTAAIQEGIGCLGGVPGRLERIPNGFGATLLVDYAHTPDALAKVLGTLRPLTSGRIITVFGCGGDRDAGKRALMGEIAAHQSDLLVLTSDNPRTEDPHHIIDEIERGVARVDIVRHQPTRALPGVTGGYWIEPDRHAAIRLALKLAVAGDILLVAGKGHEDYQIIGRERFHFDDREVLRSEIEQRG
jgi:UDP-N-acetylmuramoyl-L-alanyl-D-glutamate--2,6-diaminopimelate ligase